jgi:hypothetical protein
MPSKKDQWISGREAAELLTEQSGHKVDPSYVRMLAREGKIKTRAVDKRTNEYLKEDVLRRKVKQKKSKSVSKLPETIAENQASDEAA